MVQKQQAIGLTNIELEKLCQQTRIEQTLHLLFTLNHWAKARERLFFADRQGLYNVKTALIRQAHKVGAIVTHAYIDGSRDFGRDLNIDMAADMAAEAVLLQLEEDIQSAHTDIYTRIARQFYITMTGKTTILLADVQKLDRDEVQAYIRMCLERLERTARATHRPIPTRKLTELCIAPSDLLGIHDRRFYELGNWDSWDALDGSDLRKLDPEGLSLIAFHYTSPISHYIFHLPLRLAETFLTEEHLLTLKNTPLPSRESGEYYGRAITEAESLQQPISGVLRELEIDIASICPRQLSDKQEYLMNQAMRYAAWSEEQEFYDGEEEQDETFWRDLCLPARPFVATPTRVRRPLESCPLCARQISALGMGRFTHWQQEHGAQDLTFQQATWLLNQAMTKEQFCQEFPPDYRSRHAKGHGTRYWHWRTLRQTGMKSTPENVLIGGKDEDY